MDIIRVIFTALLSVLALFGIAKLMGHKQVAQLDFFDYISGITIGSIGAELATEIEEPWKPLIALAIYGCVSILLCIITRKYPKSRKYINGTPTILMNGGKIYRENLKKAKLDLSEFMLLCREMGYFDLREIQTAIFEHNGKMSILPRSQNRPLSAEDISLNVDEEHIGTELIMDGEIMGENLKRLGLDTKWLNNRISSLGYSAVKEVLLCVYRADEERLDIYPVE